MDKVVLGFPSPVNGVLESIIEEGAVAEPPQSDEQFATFNLADVHTVHSLAYIG